MLAVKPCIWVWAIINLLVPSEEKKIPDFSTTLKCYYKIPKINRIHTFTKNGCYSPLLCVEWKCGNVVAKYSDTRPGHLKILWIIAINNQNYDKA